MAINLFREIFCFIINNKNTLTFFFMRLLVINFCVDIARFSVMHIQQIKKGQSHPLITVEKNKE